MSTTHYKLNVFWDQWVPQVRARALTDAMAIQRLAAVNRLPFVVACDQELWPSMQALGITVSDNFVRPHLTRVYLTLDEGVTEALEERLKDIETDIDFVEIKLTAPEQPVLYDNADPYAGIIIPQDWHRIPETIPLNRAAPKGTSEPMFSPFL